MTEGWFLFAPAVETASVYRWSDLLVLERRRNNGIAWWRCYCLYWRWPLPLAVIVALF